MARSMTEFSREFRRLFPDLGPANLVLDRVLSAATLTPHLDTLALDDAISRVHGPEADGALADRVAALYGNEAVAWVRSAI